MVKFDSYRPATGRVKIVVVWLDENPVGSGTEWIKNAKTGKAMEVGWVFGGSHLLVMK
jgi:hypothetical protein